MALKIAGKQTHYFSVKERIRGLLYLLMSEPFQCQGRSWICDKGIPDSMSKAPPSSNARGWVQTSLLPILMIWFILCLLWCKMFFPSTFRKRCKSISNNFFSKSTYVVPMFRQILKGSMDPVPFWFWQTTIFKCHQKVFFLHSMWEVRNWKERKIQRKFVLFSF